MKQKTKKYLLNFAKYFTLATLLSGFIIMSMTFIVGWLSPDKTVLITLNSVGEMVIEIPMLALSWVCLLAYGIWKIRDSWNEREMIEEYRKNKIRKENEERLITVHFMEEIENRLREY
jgi:hypothetical protein